MKRKLRTGILIAGVIIALVLGASFALAQDEGADPAVPADTLDEIAEDLEGDLAPLFEAIRDRTYASIDDAVAAGVLTDEQAEAIREGVERFGLPEGFPFRQHRRAPHDFEAIDPGCFGFGPEGAEVPEDCPELPDGFPFELDQLRALPMPEHFEFGQRWDHLSDELDEFVGSLDFDFEQLEELLESGMALDEALTEMGVDLEAALAEARDAAIEKIEELADEGVITQDKAQHIREMLEGLDLSSGLPFGLHLEMEDFDPENLNRFWPHGQGFFGEHHGAEEPEEG